MNTETFKFSCPRCGQHIACDESYSGVEISCPSCSVPIQVPTPKASAPSGLRIASPEPVQHSATPTQRSLTHFPLQIRFKIVALAPQIIVEDARGDTLCYVKQKLLKLKEDIQLFSDSSKSRQIASIKANKVIDWSARYFFTDQLGKKLGSVGRQGMRSLWRARYDVFQASGDISIFKIQEENPWSKIMDSVLGEIPVLGMFTGYLFHPTYLASRPDGTPAMRVRKQPAFWEGKFRVEVLTDLAPHEETNLLYSFLMLLLLERRRG